jgi:hypothetical protein
VVGEDSRRVCGRGIRSALDSFMAAELSIYRQRQTGAAAAGLDVGVVDTHSPYLLLLRVGVC